MPATIAKSSDRRAHYRRLVSLYGEKERVVADLDPAKVNERRQEICQRDVSCNTDGMARELAWLKTRIERAFASVEDGDLIALRQAFASTLEVGAIFLKHLRWDREPEDSKPSKVEGALRLLARALSDANRGVESPLLKAKKIGHRPPDSKEVWILRARVAAGIELLMRAGESKKMAINRVVRDYPNLRKLVRPGQKLIGCASAWHRDFFAGRVEDNDARREFDRFDFGSRFCSSHYKTMRMAHIPAAKRLLETTDEEAIKLITGPASKQKESI